MCERLGPLPRPVPLLIDEIEALRSAIAEREDWPPFEDKAVIDECDRRAIRSS
jgi:hypothetical protein